MTVRNEYEVSSEGAVRHWPVAFDRLENTTPVQTEPAAVLSRTAGTQVTGTVLELRINETAPTGGNDAAVIDFTASMVYWHNVRNVLTYDVGVAELTWGAINIGDPIYYDRSASMPANTYLSTSPLDISGAPNPLFGYVVQRNDADDALYPKGGATASTQTCAVMQRGAGA
jgi:hypothetical protein